MSRTDSLDVGVVFDHSRAHSYSLLFYNQTPVYATSMYQYLVATKLVDTCIVVVANQPKKPVK